MKKPKKAKIKIETVLHTIYQFECPHCKHYFRGSYISEYTTRLLCPNCFNEIIVDKDWNAYLKAKGKKK